MFRLRDKYQRELFAQKQISNDAQNQKHLAHGHNCDSPMHIILIYKHIYAHDKNRHSSRFSIKRAHMLDNKCQKSNK